MNKTYNLVSHNESIRMMNMQNRLNGRSTGNNIVYVIKGARAINEAKMEQ